MIVPRLIERKRDGFALEPGQIRELVLEYAAGNVPDYQMASFLMAVYFRGLDNVEMTDLMEAMLDSGDRLDLSHLTVPRIDKHSTGGVGDKTSLVLAPLIASVGIAVPMMSGRGLGHTGGTLDKLESIPGFRIGLTLDEAKRQVEKIGCAMLGQTLEIVPADRKLYALRDATATVEVIPLIAASIMSKKISESLTGLVLDVKSGSGSFLPKLEDEIALAKAMIELGADHGCPVVALITAMDRPLGFACGNALEMVEAIDVLKGGGPADLVELTLELGAEMLLLAGTADDRESARQILREAISSGRALSKLEEIVEAQGGDARIVANPSLLGEAPLKVDYPAGRDGFVQSVEPRAVGHGVIELGGGRRSMEDDVDPSVGFVISCKPGDRVTGGTTLAVIHARDDAGVETGKRWLGEAISIGDDRHDSLPLISHRITGRGVESLVAQG